MDSWFFQACTEMIGWFYPFDPQTCIKLDPSVLKISDQTLNSSALESNEYYGERNIKATEVVFMNGDVDVWHLLSLLKSDSKWRIANYMHGTGHCADMYPASSADPDVLVKGRQVITDNIAKWLSDSADNM